MTKFETIVEALARDAKVIVRFDTFKGAADVAKFSAKYANDADALHYAQTRIFEKGVKYTTHYRAAY